METKYSYGDYLDNSKQLFKMLFGEELFTQLENTPLKSIDWEGIDITTPELTGTCFNLKERFSKKRMKSADRNNETLLDMFIQSIFHYGFQQSYDSNEMNRKHMKLFQSVIHEMAEKKKKEDGNI